MQRYSRLIASKAGELGRRPMVLPNGEFFPDAFRADAPSLKRLVKTMQGLAGMDDIPIRTQITGAATTGQTGSCASGACSVPMSSFDGTERLFDDGQSWVLQVPEAELRHPVVLTTNLARSLAYVFLVETRVPDEVIEPPLDVTADLAAVALGLGTLMLQGSYIYAKSCSGPSIVRVTSLSVGELAIAFALFVANGEHKPRQARAHLSATQQVLFDEATRLVEAHRPLVHTLRTRPEDVARGAFVLDTPQSWLGRVLGRRRSSPPPPPPESGPALEELEALLIEMPPASSAGRQSRPPPSSEERALRALVEQELGEARRDSSVAGARSR